MNEAPMGNFKSQISKSHQLGFVGVGCRPQRVSESKGQPSVVIGLPQLASNYRAGLGFYVLCVGT